MAGYRQPNPSGIRPRTQRSTALAGCVGARIGHGVATIEATLDMRCSFIWWWKRGRSGESYHFYPELNDRLKMSSIFGREIWPDCTFVQFLMADDDSVQAIRRDNPGVPNVGGLDGLDRPPPAPPADMATDDPEIMSGWTRFNLDAEKFGMLAVTHKGVDKYKEDIIYQTI